MTDRVNTLTVVLSNPTRTDDVEPIAHAIAQIRGVESVAMGEISAGTGARVQEQRRLHREVMDALNSVFRPDGLSRR